VIKRFHATIAGNEKRRVYLELPFDPAEVWGPRDRYHVTGTIENHGFRGVIERAGARAIVALGAAYRRGTGFSVGDTVAVAFAIEGPQREGLAPDVAAALDAEPEAARFYDSLATFYRKGYLRWIDATKRSPEVRAQRIAEFVRLLKAGQKQRS
jgi:hypothetical protein